MEGTGGIRGLAVIAALVMAFAAGAPAAGAQSDSPPQASVLVDSLAPKLVEADDGGWTVDVALTNVTLEELEVNTQAGDGAQPGSADPGCTPTLDKATLPPAAQTAIKVTVPAVCTLADDKFPFEIDVEGAGATLTSIQFTAGPKPDPKPNWDELIVFPILLIAGLAIAFLAWAVRSGTRKLSTPLQYLEKSWSFKDSWVANITIGAGLLTGIFGSSEVLTAMLGEKSEAALALATVGAAISAALIAAGPLILLGTKTRDDADLKEDDKFTVGGLLAASSVVFAGALGELWVLSRSAGELDLGGAEDYAVVAGALGALVLLVYALRTTLATIRSGTLKPPPPDRSETLVAADVIAGALLADKGYSEEQIEAILADIAPGYPLDGTSPGDSPAPRRSAALF